MVIVLGVGIERPYIPMCILRLATRYPRRLFWATDVNGLADSSLKKVLFKRDCILPTFNGYLLRSTTVTHHPRTCLLPYHMPRPCKSPTRA